jgi:hypothetical protein
MTEQMLPTEQGEKDTSLLDVVGCIMYCALALHSDEERGQQVPEREQPVVHYSMTGSINAILERPESGSHRVWRQSCGQSHDWSNSILCE